MTMSFYSRPVMERVGEHPVPQGPLAARWLAYELDEARAGTTGGARVRLENAGSAPWVSRGVEGVQLAYHWLDPLGNPIVWDGVRTPLGSRVEPGDSVDVELRVDAPRPPGRYRLAFDLVEEHRFWFAELGGTPLEIPASVLPRIAERRIAVVVHGPADGETAAALSAQEEPTVEKGAVAIAHLAPGALPAPDWTQRLLDAHEEGYAAVGGAVEPLGGLRDRRRLQAFEPWSPGGGRNPRFEHPLLFPSLLGDLMVGEHDGLPAYAGEDALFDGRVVVRLRLRSDRRSA
jgi:hypothetical protein